MNNNPEIPSQIHSCPTCEGSGVISGNKCKACSGFGTILFLDNDVLYWGQAINFIRITQTRYEAKVRVLINGLFFSLGFLGLLSLFKVFYDLYKLGEPLYNFIYLDNSFTLIFWLSLLVDMYLIYRLHRESKVSHPIKKKPWLYFKAKSIPNQPFDWLNIDKYEKINIAKNFNKNAFEIIENTWLLASKLKQGELQNIHLFISLLADRQVRLVFHRLGIGYDQLASKVKFGLKSITTSGRTKFSPEIYEIFLRAYLQAYNQRKLQITSTDLLFASSQIEGFVKEILYDLSVTEKEISHVIAWVDLHKSLIRQWHEFKYKASSKPKNIMNRSYTAVATPNLDRISQDMTLYARAGAYSPCLGREKETAEILRVLETDKLGAILIGPPGIGKRTIIEGIARLMVTEDLPSLFQDKRLVSMSVSGLVAGASRTGDLEARVITVMNEIARSKNIILFIEDIHHLVGISTDSGEAMDVAEVLAEQMQKFNFHVIATTTPEFYKKYIEKSSLATALQKIIIKEPTSDEAIKILEAKALELEARNKVYFSYQALIAAVKFAKEYLHDEYLPAKAIKIIQEAILSVKETRGPKSIITHEDVAIIISGLTGIPVAKISVDESQKLLNLEQKIHERVVGQDLAVNLVASALRRARTELRGGDKPIASFLFLGSTGVGKTQVAKTLAQVYFGSSDNMIRIDMSEFQSSDALTKLIGDAQTGSGGYLTEAVRKKPFSLILLDEIEKATPDILNIFLQVLDDGRLTEATGKTVDFTNSIIIGTSNAGTQFIQDGIKRGDDLEKIRQALIDTQLKNYFRPEFLNRFDGIIVFHPLGIDHVVTIAKLFLSDLTQRLETKGIGFVAEEAAVRELANLGFDPAFGARPLRRVIQDKVEDNLAKLLLARKIDRRDKVILKQGLKLEIKKASHL